jgi:phosphoglycolate phosphatase-like HAD superfamily hydrolase
MAVHAIIFDIDGTLVDTNPSHVEAWRRAFSSAGYDVPTERIEAEIGKGGDLLVPAILGDEAEKRDGERLRKNQKQEFLNIASSTRFRVFPCVPQLFEALRERDVRTALATSSDRKHLQATCDSAGLDLPGLADVLVTKDDAEASKPEPDLVIVAVEKLGLTPGDCAMVGDTIYDAQACCGAGVVFLGLESGGTPAGELLEAGAAGVWRDTEHLLDDLDHALAVASVAEATSE